MALRQRIYFFDPANDDRFNSRDIPTEQTMKDWSDSVPFIKEVGDRAMLSRAGIAKTTTDAKVNSGDNTDLAGVSPVGFTTFVRPAQIPVILDSASITWARVPRGGATNTDSGGGILDWRGTVNFPAIPVVEDTDDIVTVEEYEVYRVTGTVCLDNASGSTIIPPGTPITDVIAALVQSVQTLTDQMVTVAALSCQGAVDIGDTVMTLFPSSEWGSKWLEPNGQSLAVADYPALHSKIGYTYGGAGLSFNLPNLTGGNPYLRAQAGPPTAYLAATLLGSNSVSLNNTNIPLHTHTFSGNTNTDGAHTHDIPAKDSNGTANSARRGDASDGTWSFGSDGAHSHSFSGTTAGYGQNPVTPISIQPEYKRVYLKMKVR